MSEDTLIAEILTALRQQGAYHSQQTKAARPTLSGGGLRQVMQDIAGEKAHSGLALTGLQITGTTDLTFQTLPHAWVFADCAFTGTVDIQGVRAVELHFIECTFLNGVSLNGARTEGNLVCSGSRLISLSAERATRFMAANFTARPGFNPLERPPCNLLPGLRQFAAGNTGWPLCGP